MLGVVDARQSDNRFEGIVRGLQEVNVLNAVALRVLLRARIL